MTDYKLVPVEPIRRAMDALERFANDTLAGRNSAHELRELLAAAPAVQGEPVGRVKTVGGYPDESEHTVEWLCKYRDLKDGDLLYTAPQPAEQQSAPAVQGEPVGYVSQDFLDGKWNMDHIAKYDEGQISRAIPVFAKPPQPAPDVAMQVMEALATILRKAQGRTDAETGECIDIGAECMAIRREFDRRSKTARGVNGLAEALSGAIEYLDSDAGHGLWRDTVLSQLKEALAAHRKGDDV